jgi:uncharacterized protein YgiB involved in biofilm formation
MFTQSRKKLAIMAATGLVTLMLASTPARANHDNDIVAPLIAGFALGALLNYGGSTHHYQRYQYQRYGHYRQGSGHGYDSHRHNSHYKKGHNSYGQYSHQPRYSSSQGGYYTPRHKY